MIKKKAVNNNIWILKNKSTKNVKFYIINYTINIKKESSTSVSIFLSRRKEEEEAAM